VIGVRVSAAIAGALKRAAAALTHGRDLGEREAEGGGEFAVAAASMGVVGTVPASARRTKLRARSSV